MQSPEAGIFRQVFAELPVGIVLADRQGTIKLWNSAAESIFGYPLEETLGRSLDTIVPERFHQAHWSGYRKAMEKGETKYHGQVMVTRSARRDGTTIYLDLAFAILRDSVGEVMGALAAVRDITERYTRERALRDRVAELEQQVKALTSSGTTPSA